ncbi:IclR family transcriptional regulator [Williamsia sp.]|uniref:IclR family transcriptional regulator n=1 Tax=Williamsia sp. TaxID=1872085 RepID=UPI002F92C08F
MTSTVSDGNGTGQPSPPTQRVVRTIELLTTSIDTPLSLAEIVRRTGLSRATAHAVLAQLTQDGWVTRRDGNFSISTGFVALVQRAERGFPMRRLAASVLHHMAGTLDIPAFLAERTGESITVTEVVGTPALEWIRPGRRVALRPTVCREFVAWSPDDEITRWVDAAPTGARHRLRDVLGEIRERGYAIERMTPDHAQMVDALASLRESPVPDSLRSRVDGLLTELTTIDYLADETVGQVAVVTIGAPIFDESGRVVASIVAVPNREMSADELRELGKTVSHAAGEVSAAHSG